jgi:hypothetical protein
MGERRERERDEGGRARPSSSSRQTRRASESGELSESESGRVMKGGGYRRARPSWIGLSDDANGGLSIRIESSQVR